MIYDEDDIKEVKLDNTLILPELSDDSDKQDNSFLETTDTVDELDEHENRNR